MSFPGLNGSIVCPVLGAGGSELECLCKVNEIR